MVNTRHCQICNCNSEETAVFTCTYGNGEMHICLECLAQGIIEINRDSKIVERIDDQQKYTAPVDLQNAGFEMNSPQEVYGFSCQGCGSLLFTHAFPYECDCGHVNTEITLNNLK